MAAASTALGRQDGDSASKLLFSEELTGDNKQYEGWEEKATNEAKLRQKLFK